IIVYRLFLLESLPEQRVEAVKKQIKIRPIHGPGMRLVGNIEIRFEFPAVSPELIPRFPAQMRGHVLVQAFVFFQVA
ncbi:hypothetical protein, partial [Psychroserpens mesophilus]|uniref:hypothetical protein n=1 Tax=Psychroserpens mesophilus TaxID=325473 RepID=UPI003D65EDB7